MERQEIRAPLWRGLCLGMAVFAASLALAACGGTTSQTSQVRAKLMQYALAFQKHDYRTLCTQVLAPALVEKLVAVGLSCEQAVKMGTGSVKGATFTISKQVALNGSSASVGVLTQNPHERPQLAQFELIRTSAGWRISALGNPVG